MIRVLLIALWLPAIAQGEITLNLPPGAVETAREIGDPGSYALPTGAFSSAAQPSQRLEGRVLTKAWRVPSDRADTLSLLQVVRDQLVDAGYQVIFQCDTRSCGGFDFRFNTHVLPPPAMEVTLGDFRFLSATDKTTHLGVLVSRSPRGGFIQITEVSPSGAVKPSLAPAKPLDAAIAAGPLGERLRAEGHAILEGVTFESGQTQLDEDSIASLAPLAEYLGAVPEASVLIVGHTDSVGALSGNIALSRTRAQAVRGALIGRYGISPDRVAAEGAGFLAPRDTNATEEGRTRNRRVEVVLR